MNLHGLFSWKPFHSIFNTYPSENSSTPAQGQLSKVEPNSRPIAGDVAHLPSSGIGDYHTAQILNTEANHERSEGLINVPELSIFFKEDYHAMGRHDGATLKSHEALELGRNSIISRFQNTLTGLIWQKKANIYKLQNQLIEIEGIDHAMSKQLSLAQEYVGEELSELRQQFEKADKGTGWVLEPLNRYQIGFRNGLRETTTPKY